MMIADRTEYDAIFEELAEMYDKRMGRGYGDKYRELKRFTDPLCTRMQMIVFEAIETSNADPEKFLENAQKVTILFANVIAELLASALFQSVKSKEKSVNDMSDEVTNLFMMGTLNVLVTSINNIMNKDPTRMARFSFSRDAKTGEPVSTKDDDMLKSTADEMLADLLRNKSSYS